MSYFKQAKTTCGRYVPKPSVCQENSNYDDETTLPLQDQIENLRAKISLKEKYNKALREEVAETNSGAAELITELTGETRQLRDDLAYEKRAEQHAIKKALRTHRLFYLAVSDKEAHYAVNWLDDKIFAASKTLNDGLSVIRRLQTKLRDAEMQVSYLEECPVPGSELWERRAEDDRVHLECAIEARKVNRDAALILNKKYHEILDFLQLEKGRWPRIALTMENTLKRIRAELLSMEAMLEDAIKFREEAKEKLELTEQASLLNRKERRSQMNRIKKNVEKALEANLIKHAVHQTGKAKPRLTLLASKMLSPSKKMIFKIAREIQTKQNEVLKYENLVRQLVEAMMVSDIRECPKRLITVRKVNQTLQKDIKMKQELLELLLKHKSRLELILYYFRYSGEEKELEYYEALAEKQQDLEDEERELEVKRFEMNKDGKRIGKLRFAMIGLDEVLHHGLQKRPKQHGRKNEELQTTMARILNLLKELVASIEDLNKCFPANKNPRRHYENYVKFPIQYAKHIRVGAPDEMDVEEYASDPDIDLIDSRIPSREELKRNSEKFYRQALLQRGRR